MSTEIRIPNIGDAEEVQVIELCVQAGDVVGEEDAIVVIESDKASMEVPAGIAGTIETLLVAIGDEVAEGAPIARIDIGRGAVDSEAAKPVPKRGKRVDSVQPAPDTRKPVVNRGGETEVSVSVPDIGDAKDVVVIEVGVQAGTRVEPDDLIVVVESDKASMEIPAGSSGEVLALHVKEGDEVDEGTLLATLRVASGTAVATELATETAGVQEPRPAEMLVSMGEALSAETQPPVHAPVRDTGPSSRVYAGPATRRLARELGVRLSEVAGSGGRGRIVKDDVKAFVKERMSGGAESSSESTAGGGIPAIPVVDFAKFGPVEELPMSRVRKAGAANLHRSWLNVAHVTQHDEADVTELEAFRQSLKTEAQNRGAKITPLAFIIKACCYALKEFPTFNASLNADASGFILKRYYNIGMAVDTPDGLLVPVVREADKKGVWDLSEEIVDLADRAREGKLDMAELQGGTFTVSSLGAIGGTGFTPIVNAPEVAILGVARLATRPMWDGTEFATRKTLPLSLSYDHRAINGAEAGRFVVHLTELLLDIRRLSL
ncbi:MAG: dihydrolipoyllysine-residue acetyltransferase [Kiritimatiellia bacterium]|jgi:pyruvate dehydrogenase E2 component (dihydrolipoamide acetyltransferase)|nr:dihydrolipoyllysine-residue acetyltransferase [Pseudomonadales bacterium]MDP6470902.1 dihydrolipoyllysine-residue acetyltransferase [Pseudomonadales bacterium]MDP6825913.1 dihydrolipoyllysine-residue acetyltransferase [Pseudomonadales bacterium]MDP7024547.1 dihydrolipoyllysine-residue acetyltransferase [Kiritimatiellia bacterium]|tara:strand:+ start:200 stop:1843 length:1644 start_codon:yes stop_codon:yes gene_type:complete